MLPSSKAAVKTGAKISWLIHALRLASSFRIYFSLKPVCRLLVAEIHLEGIMRVRNFWLNRSLDRRGRRMLRLERGAKPDS